VKKILIVDDDVRILNTTRKVLETTGAYEVVTEDSGQRAVAAAASFLPDLVILDVMMPGMDGGDVAKALGAQPATRAIPILFLTSLVSKKDAAVQARPQDAEQYLAKSAGMQELCRRVAELLAQ
jgi:CheY-like chemotaxis protein